MRIERAALTAALGFVSACGGPVQAGGGEGPAPGPEAAAQVVDGDGAPRAGIGEADISEEIIAAGGLMFNNGPCTKCHLANGVGGERAPNLGDDEWLHSDGSFLGIRETIWAGVSRDELVDPARPFAMNPKGGIASLDGPQLDTLAAYVWSLSRR
ncbi:MAG: hypothetical protein ABFS34_10045 [Gemmatimonadota bacterium]